MENNALESRLKHLERKTLYLTGFCGLLVVGLILMAVGSFTQQVKAAENSKVLHLKGLVIEDAQGRARILLGAPFPTVHDRLRQDSTSTAMMFLDEQGHDRFSVGQSVTPQINGKVPPNFHRVGGGAGYGLIIYDPNGNERGGMGFGSNGSTVSRAALALDRPNGDAVGLIVDDKTGFAGLVSFYPPKIGNGATGVIIGTQDKKAFVTVKDLNDIQRASLGIGPEQEPSFHFFDKTGKPGSDLVQAKPGTPPAQQ